jgi:hypothetical protein
MLKKKLKFRLFLSKVTLRGYITRSFGEHHEDQPTDRQFCSTEQQCRVSDRQEVVRLRVRRSNLPFSRELLHSAAWRSLCRL